MMGKGFLSHRNNLKVSVWRTLLVLGAGVCGSVHAAEVRDVRIASTDSGVRVVLELSEPAKHKAFLLDNPGRVVLDVSRSTLKAQLPAVEGPITALRSGKLPNNGLRLVFEVTAPVTIQTSRLAATAENAERLVLDIAGPAVPRTVSVTPAA